MVEEKKKYNICEPLRIGKELAGIKVTNMVGTFMKENSDSFQKIRVMTTKVEPEKVTNTVGTFLNEGRNGFEKVKIKTLKTESEKVTNTVGTFLN